MSYLLLHHPLEGKESSSPATPTGAGEERGSLWFFFSPSPIHFLDTQLHIMCLSYSFCPFALSMGKKNTTKSSKISRLLHTGCTSFWNTTAEKETFLLRSAPNDLQPLQNTARITQACKRFHPDVTSQTFQKNPNFSNLLQRGEILI